VSMVLVYGGTQNVYYKTFAVNAVYAKLKLTQKMLANYTV